MTLDLDARAAHWPDRPAVVDHAAAETLSYGDLAARAERAAGRLAALGVEPGDAAVVLARNRPELLAFLFGARRLGATLAPVSHRLPADTVAALAERIDPAVVLAEGGFAELAVDADAEVASLDDYRETDPVDVPDDESDAVPLYLHTGGTTGVPKVVRVSERQLEWNCVTEAAAWGLGKHAVSPILLPMYHTGGWNLLTLPTLYVGGRVVLLREFDPGEALDAIEEHGATQVFGVAAIYQAMAAHDEFDDADFSTVEWFMSGGGPTPDAVTDAYRNRGETFVQGYGLTEGGPNNLYVDPTRPDAHERPDSVGRPFPDCEARVVDDDGTELGSGEVGELELRGPVTADGYLDTADGTFDGEWVSTGDLVRRDEDGDYYVVGRTDNMFVSGGENVYPEEVERALEGHPDVAAVGVVGVPHERWGRVPKAVVVGDADPADLDAYARDRLADYQVPKEYALAADLPRSGPGKLNRDELQERYG
jgi:fatty-acyl-CoA synthase